MLQLVNLGQKKFVFHSLSYYYVIVIQFTSFGKIIVFTL